MTSLMKILPRRSAAGGGSHSGGGGGGGSCVESFGPSSSDVRSHAARKIQRMARLAFPLPLPLPIDVEWAPGVMRSFARVQQLSCTTLRARGEASVKRE